MEPFEPPRRKPSSQLAPQSQFGPVPLRVRSTELLGKRGQLVIEHNGREYRLRLTQGGKLILTA
jgi:hemin uptake protein HemP